MITMAIWMLLKDIFNKIMTIIILVILRAIKFQQHPTI